MYKDMILPNIEVKFAKSSIHQYALTHSIKVIVNRRFIIKVSPLELQIAYKLYLGSEKDIGDAVFLYDLFRELINNEELRRWCKKFRVECSILEERVNGGG